ncbi:CARDB domain-containing protein [Halorubrum sp. Hd13]|uniref:CARDB domain-containing protein n=1 Tax=Halorubrum sp. Hd13 TaxID=1480728 RepID=UPI000B97FCF5|nr:CARDB domain-containing protein [Halorubrum sp. Hd13]OYR45037.1 DUF1102 domain-containing protein [Halorubrum sp. Hd13]
MPTARRTLTLALLLVAAGSLAFATGAAVVDGPADTFADDDLAVQPADGPNGNYSYLNDANEIAIDVSASNPNIKDPSFEGVNVGTTGTIDGIFTITYTAERYAHVWIEYDGDGEVAFVSDGDSIEGEANNVTLGPNQTVTVGLALDAGDSAAGTQLGADEFSINAKLAEPEQASGTTATGGGSQQAGGGPTTTVRAPNATYREFVASGIGRGESVRWLAEGMHLDGDNVTLEGIDLDGIDNERVELDAAGSPDPFADAGPVSAPTTPHSMAYLALDHDFAPDAVDEMTVRFSAAPSHLNATGTDSEDVTLYRRTAAGAWEEVPVEVVDDDVARMLGLPEDRVHFRATTGPSSTFAVAAHAPRYDVTEATVAPEAIDPGENVTVRTTLRNGGGAAGERTVTLTANGTPVASETVALDPNETATVAFDATFESPGAYDLAVDGTSVGERLLVGDPASDDAGGSGDESNAGSDGSATVAGTTEEPFGIDPADLAGPLALVAIVLAALALVRRMPR